MQANLSIYYIFMTGSFQLELLTYLWPAKDKSTAQVERNLKSFIYNKCSNQHAHLLSDSVLSLFSFVNPPELISCYCEWED